LTVPSWFTIFHIGCSDRETVTIEKKIRAEVVNGDDIEPVVYFSGSTLMICSSFSYSIPSLGVGRYALDYENPSPFVVITWIPFTIPCSVGESIYRLS
jgi:hypothetical protein